MTTNPDPTLEVQVPAELAQLEAMAHRIETFGRDAALPARTVSAMVTAIDEVVTNVITYGFPAGSAAPIRVRLRRAADELVAEIEDDGRPFDPISIAEPDLTLPLEQRPIGGLGMHLVRQLMDVVSYRRAGGRNLLTLHKRLAAEDSIAPRPSRTEGLLLSQSTEDGVASISLRGRVGVSGALALERALHSPATRGDSIVLNCRELHFIGSAGLRALLVAAKQLQAHSRKLRLVGLSPAVREILEVSGLLGLFTVE